MLSNDYRGWNKFQTIFSLLHKTTSNTATFRSERHPRNLKDLLVCAKLKSTAPPTPPGNTPCESRGCKTCKIIKQDISFTSHTTGQTYRVRAAFTCKTRNVVYMIQCKKCGLQYVGETENPLHIRINGHRSDIRTKKLEKPVASHFQPTRPFSQGPGGDGNRENSQG